jgi:5-methylcytosine-specific restriction enzyme A
MPRSAKKPCRYPGCPETVEQGSYCPAHQHGANRRRNQQIDDKRASAAARGYDRNWQKLRLMHLRTSPLCVRCEERGWTVPATEVDHIRPLARGGTHDVENLQSLCKSCHSRKTARELRREEGNQTMVTIIAGPPGAGKTTYARKHMQWGDLIVDVDGLYAALSGLPWYEKPQALLPFVLEARDAVLDRLQGESEVRHAWVITSEADAEKRRRLAQRLAAGVVIVMETSASDCIKRIAQDERRAEHAQLWGELVNQWWKDYSPNEGERILSSGRG